MCCDVRLDWVRRLALSYSLSYCPVPLCVLCYSIVGLVLCLCDRVVSLWNGGDGLCWVEGRVVSTVYRSLSTLYVLWCVFQCGVLWNGGGVGRVCSLFVCLLCLSLLLPLLLLVFGVVRAQLCEHARYPRTPLRSPCCLSCLLFFVPRLSSCPAFPVIVEWRWEVSPCVGVLCWHDGYG